MRAILLPSVLLVLATSAAGQEPALQGCRAIAEPTARLGCYDALADMGAKAAGLPATAAPVVAARAPMPPAPAATAMPSRDAAFGLPAAARPEAADNVQSAVGASFDGWGANRSIRLDNGQVWQVIDGSSVSLPEGARRVTVKRGALSSFYLDIEGLKTSPRVRRVE